MDQAIQGWSLVKLIWWLDTSFLHGNTPTTYQDLNQGFGGSTSTICLRYHGEGNTLPIDD